MLIKTFGLSEFSQYALKTTTTQKIWRNAETNLCDRNENCVSGRFYCSSAHIWQHITRTTPNITV